MPKFLYLMRHAESAEKHSNQHDRDRELTSTGVKEALQIGTFLNKKKILLNAIYTSTAIRAEVTAQLISDVLKVDSEKMYKDDELYNASVRTFLEFLHNLDDQYTSVLCVGHNPTISYLAEYLTKAVIGDMPPAGMISMKLAHTWKDANEGTGEFEEFITPHSLIQD